MIIWLNGAFGVGKTQTAFELHSRIPGSFVFDPEQIGFSLCKVMPPAMRTGDFQNHLCGVSLLTKGCGMLLKTLQEQSLSQ